MDYKSVIPSRQARFALLKALSFVPDSLMLRIQYRIKMGFWPDLKHPRRFTEKIQLYKMRYRNTVLPSCVDKYAVRGYVSSKGLGDILIPLYGVYDDAAKIDFSSLPEKFVAKTTDGGGGNNVVIVNDKSTLDESTFKAQLNGWLGIKDINAGREWAYTGMEKSRIVIEEMLEDPSEGPHGLVDYKFFCFNGKPFCLQVDSGRFDGHHQNYYDMDWKSLGVHCTYPEGEVTPMPENFGTMKKVAAVLSSDFPFVRVDLYNIGGVIRFGELTFYPSSGYGTFHPDSFDFTLGEQFTEY